MEAPSSKRVVIGKKEHLKYPYTRSHLIYDEPHIFQVTSERSLSHLQQHRKFHPCNACLKEANRPTFTANVQHPKRCSRLPATPADLERSNRPKTVPPKRTSNDCNWNNFIKKKSKHGK